MAIVSISLNEGILDEIDKLQNELGFSGRSEVVRAGVRMLLADSRDKAVLEGKLNSVLLLIHTQKVEDTVTEIKHEFEDIISTQIHNHLREDKCLEVFILEGDAARIKQLVRHFQTSRKMDYVKLIVA
ncbi:CopG family transcriptional regulator, nickel-responsive regulator [Candidatus Methanophagaceae archaeon]|jgi:CopG family nickel-responsive transcriptional regulator|nr:CopG family transcriptional regulator, nickel-responsive regulator [Methanophagales archaeon]